MENEQGDVEKAMSDETLDLEAMKRRNKNGTSVAVMREHIDALIEEVERLRGQDCERMEGCDVMEARAEQAEQRVRTLREALVALIPYVGGLGFREKVIAYEALADTADASPAEGEG